MRKKYNLPKTHAMDAVCIAAAGFDVRPKNIPDEVCEIRQFHRRDRARIHHQTNRTYKRNVGTVDKPKWKTVAKNRHKGFEQKEPALDDYLAAIPESERDYVCSKLKAVPLKRYYNNMDRNLPGTVFWYEGRRYVMSGQHANGYYLRAAGQGTREFPASQCRIVANGGLVYL